MTHSPPFCRTLAVLLALVALSVGCGTESPRSEAPRAPAEEPEPPAEDPPPEPEVPPEPPPLEEPPPPPEPEPVVVEPGQSIGPVRLGMTEEELAGLDLEPTEVDPRTRAFGPYRVQMDDGAVDRIEAFLGDLPGVSLADQVFTTESHIHAIRDALGDCVWQEGGGERYRCRDGHLSVSTTHSLDPARYQFRVE
ncbi:MAG: hypothetical protein AB8I08_29760 [Sandaracinaceae bacterium]